ncbi:universal stress protein [Oceanihabitans sediminis]|uniref:Universal stress protein n=1 Tax=Oceanihabitans sediminis TaxID=1812012 RepID=A0A368P6H4_9FLAO|nr:universal stress protein [Oceanihabitans sediminis]MDX1278334.1 universal stress protein [Oceanihabitans sediminis]MDX1773339.1 universal stress protein [Oceanihabitans sediminis]RBP32771.1 nucleotide-binding universal stress UspA family protein [Oceanihabitans sediminis]RCU57694.1 universal stress protein [Oceanihabitans sediminis]
MKNIIIPVDFSQQSEYALQTGAILAKKHGATLHVLHMLELSDSIISISSSDTQNEMMFMLALARKKFEAFLDKDYLKGIEVVPVIKKHKVYSEVDAVAKELQADLIIMGSQGLTLQDGIFAGSNAEKMVRNSSTPVLIVKTEPIDFTLKDVVLATDLSIESIDTYKKAASLLSKLGSSVKLVYVNGPNKRFISSKVFNKKVKEFTAAGGSDQVEFIAGYTIEDGIIQYADMVDADLIAVITNARKGLNHFIKGSVSEDVANHSRRPVITFKM